MQNRRPREISFAQIFGPFPITLEGSPPGEPKALRKALLCVGGVDQDSANFDQVQKCPAHSQSWPSEPETRLPKQPSVNSESALVWRIREWLVTTL